MPFGRKRVGGYVTGRQRKFASLQLLRDAKASRVEFANEPAVTTLSCSTITVRVANENFICSLVFYPNIAFVA